jgi:GxxExxY protein
MLRVTSTLPIATDQLIQQVIGCGIAVHKALGSGYPEKAYARALVLEFDAQGIAYEREKLVRVVYRDKTVYRCRLDLVVGGQLIVEIKCVDSLLPVHRSQVLGYLRAAELRAGLLMNFKTGAMVDGVKRVVL